MAVTSSRYQEKDLASVPPLARYPEEWVKSMAALGERSFRAKQVFRWINARNVMSPAEMTDLSVTLRQKLAEAGLGPVLTVSHSHTAPDYTIKALVTMADEMSVETVLIPMRTTGPKETEADADAAAADDEEDDSEPALSPSLTRVTQCISTQVGCAQKCAFCASGTMGLKRHMGPDEIVAQVLVGRTLLPEGHVLSNVVLMGMGEPLHNFDATVRAVRLLTHPEGIGLSRRRVTVSTVGLVPEIAKLGEVFEGKIGLAVSLHAPTDEIRGRIVPANKRYPIRELMQALRDYPLPPRRRITIEYALIDGVNSSLENARQLASLLRSVRVKINLIPLNPVEHSDWRAPSWDAVYAFQEELVQEGYTCLIRRRRGDEISAACGQLAASNIKSTLPVVTE